jgi:hypothetical protein
MDSRLDRLEAQNRRLQLAVATLAALLVASVAVVRPSAQQPDILRAKGLVIVDDAGRQRIVLGAPLQEGANSRTGLKVLDSTGAERIGMTVLNNGDANIGLDAPRGTGDDRNTERINLIADGKGGSSIVFKDRRTFIVGRMYLDPQNLLWMQFSDFTQNPALLRRIGITGEETLRPQLQQ